MSFNPNAPLDPSQVEDERGGRGGYGGMPGGGFGGMPIGTPHVIAGGGGLGLVIIIVMLVLGLNPFGGGGYGTGPVVSQPASGISTSDTVQSCRTGADANQRTDCRIVGYVNSVQAYWQSDLSRRGIQYTPAELVLFTGATQAGCGTATEEQGPFYCPVDKKVYLDLSFFDDLQQRFGAQGGTFAQGYVVAHEYGHHIQDILGLLDTNGGANSLGPQGGSVRTELQADCFAGIWARHAADTGYLTAPTDAEIADALNAAAAVGDDHIQQMSQGRVQPETWTHGSSQQRDQWFTNGYRSGDLNGCDTSKGQL